MTTDILDQPSYNNEFLPHAEILPTQLRDNIEQFQKLLRNTELAAVVKANVYGHGLPCVDLMYMKGIRRFFVAHPSEGIEVRKMLPSDAQILVFHGICGDTELYAKYKLTPVLNSIEDIVALGQFDGEAPFWLHIDTGMNRLGLSEAELSQDLMKRAQGIMSHLGCADDVESPHNTTQLARFKQITHGFEGIKSLSATAGCYLGDDYFYDLARIGIGLYGGGPKPPEGIKLTPIMRLTAPVLSLHSIKAGEAAGYGASYEASSDRLLATLAIGYADGLPRNASNVLKVWREGELAPIIGRVSMDLTIIDVTDFKQIPKVGDRFEVLGPNAGLEAQAEMTDTLAYEWLTRLGSRVKFHYKAYS